MRGPLLAFRDCENYQSETENGSDENKPCFNLRTFVRVKTRVLFHLEHKIHLLHGNAACLSPTLRLQREATILESHFSLLSSFFNFGENKCADYLSETEFLPVSLLFLKKQGVVFVLFIQCFERCHGFVV